MSLVIAEIRDGVVYMGADTQTALDDGHKINHTCEAHRKIVKMPHGVLIGHAGTVFNANTLDAHKEWFADLEHEKLTKEFIVTRIIPKFCRAIIQNNSFEKEHPIRSGTTFLMAQGDRLFFVDDDLAVYVVPTFAAIGCGRDAALTVHEMHRGAPVREKMLKALRLSERFDNGISAPFVFIDTGSLEYEIAEE